MVQTVQETPTAVHCEDLGISKTLLFDHDLLMMLLLIHLLLLLLLLVVVKEEVLFDSGCGLVDSGDDSTREGEDKAHHP